MSQIVVLHGHFPFVIVFSLKCLLKIFHIISDLPFASKGFLILLLPLSVVESLRVVTWVQILFVLACLSVLNKNCEMPVDQCESHGRPTTSC
jgi:hypothetical protein